MKSPFAILLAIVVLVGIGISVAAITFFGPTNQDDDDAIPVASGSELPTPSSRSEALSRDSSGATANEAVTEPTETSDQQADNQDNTPQAATNGGGQSEQGTRGGGQGFGGGGNFQAVQEVMANNPELAELFQRAQSGNITQENQARMRELIQEALAEAGIEAPGGGQGGGFGAPPIQGTISAISGSILTIDHTDGSGLSTDVQIGDNTDITLIKELTSAELSEGTNVAGTVQRGEGGRIFVINLTVLPEQQDQGFGGGFRGILGGGFSTGNENTNLSTINGSVSAISEETISVETTQGTLRLTTNEETNIISISSGTLADIDQGMAATAFGGSQDNTPVQPNNIIVGSATLLEEGGTIGIRGLGRGGQGGRPNQGQ